jgi:hypothetical protein
VENPDCQLETWEVAQCPKLGPTFEQIVERIVQVDFSLSKWTTDPSLSRDCRMEVLDILSSLGEIASMLGDLGFPFAETMREHREVLEALRVPKELDGLDEMRSLWLSRSAGHLRKQRQTSSSYPKGEVANA